MVGGITESDILLAAASNAIVIGLTCGQNQRVLPWLPRGVDVRLYTIIYERWRMSERPEGMLEQLREQSLDAWRRSTFKASDHRWMLRD